MYGPGEIEYDNGTMCITNARAIARIIEHMFEQLT